jgi:hypothetical protein
MTVTQDYKSLTLTLAEKVEIRLALEARGKALHVGLAVMAADKNPRAYDALKATYYASLKVIGGLQVKVML